MNQNTNFETHVPHDEGIISHISIKTVKLNIHEKYSVFITEYLVSNKKKPADIELA